MKDEIKSYMYNPLQEKLVKILQNKNQTKEELFFRVIASYYFSKISSIMRTEIDTQVMGIIPTNTYVLALANSGFGKGKTVNFIEDQILKKFKDRFLREVLPEYVEKQLAKRAVDIATDRGLDPDEVLASLHKEYKQTGPYLFNFDSGTSPAVKQLRHKLLMGSIGSINLEMDEVGSNISSNIDIFNTFIELYDVGKIKPKITKNTTDNKRNEDIDGRTPANMLLFGTPNKLLDGGKTEEEFYNLLDMGYARRFLFTYLPKVIKDTSISPEELLEMMMDTSTTTFIEELSKSIGELAIIPNVNTKLKVSKEYLLKLIQYKNYCEDLAESLKEHQELEKNETRHRYFRALKLSGSYAFIEGKTEVTIDHLKQAIRLEEDSGEAFKRILKREKPYVKLAKYIAEIGEDVTHVDLVEDLPFYKGNAGQKQDLLNLAIAWGYKHSIIIKKHLIDGIEFLRGEALKETSLDSLILSYSDNMTTGYDNVEVPFNKLHKLFKLDNYHWINHHLKDGYRTNANAIPGFNMVVLDVDEKVSINMVKDLLEDYTYIIYTTKRHTKEQNRFRVILPISHIVKLGVEEFKRFMNNIFQWLPFEVDQASNQIAKKWLTNGNCELYTNEGKLLNAMYFIPNTKKSEELNQERQAISNMTNLEAWFYKNYQEGGRNKLLFRYAMSLKDNGYDLESVKNAVLAFNSKTPNPLDEGEIYDTVIVSLAKDYNN